MRLAFEIFVTILGVFLGLDITYRVLLLIAAAFTRNALKKFNWADPTERATRPRFTVVIPAHNEELVLASTLQSLREQNYPLDKYSVVVIADNCSDTTPQIGHAYGAIVWERTNLQERGKGYALEWAISRLLALPAPSDAFVIVDADTWVAPDFLDIMAWYLSARKPEEGAIQGRYGVLNTQQSWRSALMDGAFSLVNHVLPMGRDRLGLSISLKGNGMAFSRAVLERAPWQGHSITEDIDYGLDLLEKHGVRVQYAPQARVLAQMPSTAEQATSQRARWEEGRYRLLRERALPLLMAGLRRRDVRLCDAAYALISPPLAELAALLLLWSSLVATGAFTGILGKPLVWSLFIGVLMLGLLFYLLGGLWVSGSPKETYLSLLKAPVYIVWKFALYGIRALRRSSKSKGEWVRTERQPVALPGEVSSPQSDEVRR